MTSPSLSSRNIAIVEGSEESQIEIEPSKVTGITRCVENDCQLEIILDINDFTLAKLWVKTHRVSMLGNTVLHKEAGRENIDSNIDRIVDLVAEESPNLLFSFNKNQDTALHVAARAGRIHTIEKLLAVYANFQRPKIAEAWLKYDHDTNLEPVKQYYDARNMEDLLKFVIKVNNQGNTMMHEAMRCGKNIGAMLFQAFEAYNDIKVSKGKSLSEYCYEYALNICNMEMQSVLYLAVEAGENEVVKLIMNKCPESVAVEGLSPVVAAIMKRDEAMLEIIVQKKPDWKHLTDQNERLPIHYAASTGYLEGVRLLLNMCKCCSFRRDKYGFFPIHLASHGGHVKVIKELLGYSSDPTEALDVSQRNILHIAAKNGKLEVVRYILKKSGLRQMINQKDNKGNTPLHLAVSACHPNIVYCLTWDERVDLDLVNQNNETALDIVQTLYQLRGNSSIRQHLIWTALKSAGAKPSSNRLLHVDESRPNDSKPDEKLPKMEDSNVKGSNMTRYKERVDTLTVVSTLIITASVAACLAVPGEAQGKAYNLYHAMFQFFIICITTSLFCSIGATVILLWARLGLTELLIFSLVMVMPLLEIALVSLSLAFMAGVYTVIGKLSWLATIFLVTTVVFVVIVVLLYIILFLPSPSTNKLLRHISYYPFLFLASLAERYLEGVRLLLNMCKCCSFRRDKYGFFPIHLASHGGHVKVIKELLGYSSDPTQALDFSQRNILHIAAEYGKLEVVRYILKNTELHEMINQKDNKGNTPLHLATKSCHPKTVYYLTWNKRVNLGIFNDENETAFDIINAQLKGNSLPIEADSLYQLQGPSSIKQQLTWTALKSAGGSCSSGVLPVNRKQKNSNNKGSNPEQYSNRMENLTVVSTLIITASVAACLAVPGEANGKANNLDQTMFQVFIICIAISLFSSISATIVLFWAHLGLTDLVIYCLKIVMPVLGVALLSLSLAFMTGVYTVICKFGWLAITFLVITGIYIGVVSLLYSLLFFPSASTNKILRYMSHYPFIFLATMVEPKTNQGIKI